MPDEKRTYQRPHNIVLENRSKLILSGIDEVESFDESVIVLYSDLGKLLVKGADMKIIKLMVDSDNGEVMVEGHINSLEYSNTKSKKGENILTKLFK